MIYDLPAITQADGNRHAFATTRTMAQWVQIQTDRQNNNNVWIGGATVDVNHGAKLEPGAAQFLPPAGGDGTYIDLAQLYYIFEDTGTSDKIYPLYGRK